MHFVAGVAPWRLGADEFFVAERAGFRSTLELGSDRAWLPAPCFVGSRVDVRDRRSSLERDSQEC